MNSKIGWNHPIDESDQWDGFNEPGLEHFTGSPVQSLAREVHQNSLDAAEGDMVEVRINLRQLKVSDIPNLDELRDNFQLCYEASKSESKKAENFFKNATRILSEEKISVLEIADYNTRGMVGPAENGSPFYAFMKAKGQSRKGSDTATGSYGIGKFAPYAVSKLRTIFVSTIYSDKKGECVQLTQGKSVLMSFDRDGKRRQGIGFWGVKERCQPIQGFDSAVPKWLQRSSAKTNLDKKKGSTLHVLGFDAINNWQTHLAVSVAENFFGAISDGKLRIEIGDKYTLDQNSIYAFFESDEVRQVIKTLNNEPEQFDNCKNYLAVLKGGVEVITEESEQLHLGLCQVKVLVGENLPKKVGVLRNGMFITDALTGLKRFSDFKDFVAVFHCQSTKGNELLRSMEPPKHDDFEPARLSTREETRRGRKALEDLSGWIKSVLKTYAKDPVSEVTSIDELKDLFGDESATDGSKSIEEINPFGEVIIRLKPIRTRVLATTASNGGLDATDETSDLDEEEGNGKSGGDNDKDSDGDVATGGGGENGDTNATSTGGKQAESGGESQKAMIDINNVRAVVTGTKARRVAFTPVSTGKVHVVLREAGADSDYPIRIVHSSLGAISNGGVTVAVIAAARVTLEIEMDQNFAGALKVVAYEV